jgi:DNA polymerase-3 subunit delta
VEKGFPQSNHLIITTDTVDKRRGLFKALSSKGMIVDCSVPKGARRADQIAQESVLVEKKNSILAAGGKTMDQATYLALYEMTGFDLRTFCNNLEKLIIWVGDRTEITIKDVASILQRTKKDPIYELTNALADRSADSALFFLDSILSSGIHPLQVLSALVNQIRKLLLAKGFVKSPLGKGWQSACPYAYFQKQIMPAIVEYDRKLMDQLDRWQYMLNAEIIAPKTGSPKKSKKAKNKASTDLLIAKNPKNPYPIYLLLKKSDGFSQEKLISDAGVLAEADKKLKTSSQSPKLVLEKAILSICRT